MKNVLFVAALLLGLQSFAQQSYQLKGKVSREGKALPNVNVQVVSTNHGTVTNLYGEYQLTLQEGNYEIIN